MVNTAFTWEKEQGQPGDEECKDADAEEGESDANMEKMNRKDAGVQEAYGK